MKTRKLIKTAHLKQFKLPIFILILVTSLAMIPALPASPAMATVPPPFTGNVENDFTDPYPDVITVNDPGGQGDVGLPASAPGGTVSGNDMKDIRLHYDPFSDTLYVGINTWVIAGDVDGDGAPGGTSSWLAAEGGEDFGDFGQGESFAIAFDIDEDTVWDVVAGVEPTADTSGFSVNVYSGPQIQWAFGTPLPGHTGALYASPSSGAPDLEFTILDFSTLPTSGTDYLPTFTINSRIGAEDDNGIGEDYVPGAELGFEWDFGDAPDGPYPTLFASNGARHYIDPAVYLGPGPAGTSIDAELDGQPDPNAIYDDNDGNDDEDGVTFSALKPGQPATMTVTTSTAGYINAWIDFTVDNSWMGDQIATNVGVGAGTTGIPFTVPSGAVVGNTYARVRFSTVGGLSYDDWAPDGEVEDYKVTIEQPLDFGDAPESYGTSLPSGAHHAIVTEPAIHLGATVDAEADGQPSVGADGDDLDGNDDEDGVTLGVLTQGDPAATVTVNGGPNGGQLDAWIDFNQSGSFSGGEKIINNLAISAGNNFPTFAVPSDAIPGTTYARFRLSTNGGLSPTGFAADGEVEDYTVEIDGLDFGDAPNNYGTYLSSNGARHVLDGTHWMGTLIDKEANGHPSTGADGDDLDASADEDGVVFTSLLEPGQVAYVDVTASAAGKLDAWIDFDGDNNFADDPIFTSETLTPGTNNLNFNVPSGTASGYTYARFRMSTQGGLSPTGLCDNGEVEDYKVLIEEPPRASIGDYVWNDANENGCQDVSEDGIDDVTVRLYTELNALYATTSTSSDGSYLFDNVEPGNYYVKFGKPSGYVFTIPDNCANDATDSDADTGTGKTIVTTLTSGEIDRTWDAGLCEAPPPPCWVGGEVAQEGLKDILMSWIVVIAALLLIGIGGVVITKRRRMF